jgi:uncharacterized C2H2 Zn-finger protein
MAQLKKMPCPRCGKDFQQNSYNQAHCVVCAYEVAAEKARLKALAKRLAAKERSNGAA